MAFKDLELGKCDIAVETLGNAFRPPDVGAVFLPLDPGSAPERNGLEKRCEQDFWVPLSWTSQQV